MDSRVPPLVTDEVLLELRTPTLVLAGADDLSFPGAAVIDRVKRLVPNVETELLESCKHCPPTTEAFRNWVGDRLTRFILSPPERMGTPSPI